MRSFLSTSVVCASGTASGDGGVVFSEPHLPGVRTMLGCGRQVGLQFGAMRFDGLPLGQHGACRLYLSRRKIDDGQPTQANNVVTTRGEGRFQVGKCRRPIALERPAKCRGRERSALRCGVSAGK